MCSLFEWQNASELYLWVSIPLCWLHWRNRAKKQIPLTGIWAEGSGSQSGLSGATAGAGPWLPKAAALLPPRHCSCSLGRRPRAPGSPGEQTANQQGWHVPCWGSSACSWLVNPAQVIDPTDGESCVPRDRDLSLSQHLSEALLEWLRAGDCLWRAHGPGSWRKGEMCDLKYIY